MFWLAKSVMGRSPLGTAPRPKGRSNAIVLSGWKSMVCAGFFLGVLLLASTPHIGVVFLSFAERWYGTVLPDTWTLGHYIEALGNGLVVPSIQKSLLYSGCAVLLALAIGLGTAWVVVRSDLKIRGFLDALVMLPLAVPGLVLAFGYLSLSQESKPFHFLVGADGNPFLLLVLAYAIRRLPYVVRSAVAGLQQSNPALEEAAKSPWCITAPNAAPNLHPFDRCESRGGLHSRFRLCDARSERQFDPCSTGRALPDHQSDLRPAFHPWQRD